MYWIEPWNYTKLQLLKIMLHTHSPKYNDKSDTKERVYNPGERLQTFNTVLVILLQGFVFIKLLQCFLLLALINIDQFVASEK